MKTIATEAKDTLDWIKCRLDTAEGKINEPEDTVTETIQNETQRKKTEQR